MAKKRKVDLSRLPPSLRQTYKRDPAGIRKALARLKELQERGDDSDTSWEDDLPEEQESGDDATFVVMFPIPRKPKPAPKRKGKRR